MKGKERYAKDNPVKESDVVPKGVHPEGIDSVVCHLGLEEECGEIGQEGREHNVLTIRGRQNQGDEAECKGSHSKKDTPLRQGVLGGGRDVPKLGEGDHAGIHHDVLDVDVCHTLLGVLCEFFLVIVGRDGLVSVIEAGESDRHQEQREDFGRCLIQGLVHDVDFVCHPVDVFGFGFQLCEFVEQSGC